MTKKITLVPVAMAMSLMMAGVALAKVPAAEADKLGKDLTCVGSEKAGTKDGGPEFTGKWLGTPPGVQYLSLIHI